MKQWFQLHETGQEADSSEETYKRHHMMIDKVLRNREAELQKYADLQRKLDAAEKIEICRRIRVGLKFCFSCILVYLHMCK